MNELPRYVHHPRIEIDPRVVEIGRLEKVVSQLQAKIASDHEAMMATDTYKKIQSLLAERKELMETIENLSLECAVLDAALTEAESSRDRLMAITREEPNDLE